MSATWDSKGIKSTPINNDEVLIIDTENSRNQKRATLSSINESLSPNVKAYSDSETYAVGDVVRILDAENFICTTAVSTPESFDNTKWEPVRADLEPSMITSNMTNNIAATSIIGDGAGTITVTLLTPGFYSTGDSISVVGSASYNVAFNPISPTTITVLTSTTFTYTLAGNTDITDETGLISNQSTITLDATKGFLVDNSDQEKPLVTIIDEPAKGASFVSVPAQSLSVLMDSTGTVFLEDISTTTPKTRTDNLALGYATGVPPTGFIPIVKAAPDQIYQRTLTERLNELSAAGKMYPGGVISEGSSGLTINVTGGSLFFPGIGYVADINEPDTQTIADQSPVALGSFVNLFATGTSLDDVQVIFSASNELDVDNYNPSGASLDAIPVTGPQFQIFRLYQTERFLLVYYGTELFETVEEAQGRIDNSDFLERSISKIGSFRGYVIAKRGITSWSGSVSGTDFLFVPKPQEYSLDRGNPQNRSKGLTQEQINASVANQSTGVISNGEVTMNTVTSIDIAAGNGLIVDHFSIPFSTTSVEWADETVDLTTFSGADLTKGIIYVLKDSNGDTQIISTDDTALSASQDRTLIKLAVIRTTFGLVSNEVRAIVNLRTPLTSPVLTTKDFTNPAFQVKSGSLTEEADPSVDLTIKSSAGKIAAFGLNFLINPNSPNVIAAAGGDPISFRLIDTTGEITGTLVTDPDAAQYDNNGTLTAIPAPSPYSVKRLWCDAANSLFYMQYGTATYNSTEISAGAYNTEFPAAPALLTEYAFVQATLIIERNSTDWDDDALNQIFQGDQTGGTSSAAGGAGGFSGNLSDLVIDNDKDWNTKEITNLADVALGGTQPSFILDIDYSSEGRFLKVKEETNAANLTLEGETNATINLVSESAPVGDRWVKISTSGGQTTIKPIDEDGSELGTFVSFDSSTLNATFPAEIEVGKFFLFDALSESTGTAIESVAIISGGTGYTDAEDITITGDSSGANNADANIHVTGGVINTIHIVDGGDSYENGETCTIVGLSSAASNATGTITTNEVVDGQGQLYTLEDAGTTKLYFKGDDNNQIDLTSTEFLGPWTANHNAGGFDLTNAGNIQADSFEVINAGAGNNPVLSSNSATRDLELNSNLTISTRDIKFVDFTIDEDSSSIRFAKLGVPQYTFSGSIADWKFNELKDVNRIEIRENSGQSVPSSGVIAIPNNLSINFHVQDNNNVIAMRAGPDNNFFFNSSLGSDIQFHMQMDTGLFHTVNGNLKLAGNQQNGEIGLELSPTEIRADILLNMDGNQITLDTGQSIIPDAGGLTYNVPTGDTHDFDINSVNELSISDTAINAPTASFQENGVDISPIGKHDIWIDAEDMVSVTADAVATKVIGTGDERKAFAFINYNNGNDEFAVVEFEFPRKWDAGTITVVINWISPGEGTGDVLWELAGVSVSDGDDLVGSVTDYGTPVEVSDPQFLANNLHETARSSAITLANTPAKGDVIFLRIQRLGAQAGDTFAGDVELLGISIEYTSDTATSA